MAKLSPALQGEVALEMNAAWVRNVWYLASEGVSEKLVVAFAQGLEAKVFAQGEKFGEPNTLYILNRGLIGRKGRVLRSASVWGEDFVLDCKELMDRSPAVALTYVEVLWMKRASLDEILEQFPEEKSIIRKATVKIAATRGLLLEAKRRIEAGGLDAKPTKKMSTASGKQHSSLPFGASPGLTIEASRHGSDGLKKRPPHANYADHHGGPSPPPLETRDPALGPGPPPDPRPPMGPLSSVPIDPLSPIRMGAGAVPAPALSTKTGPPEQTSSFQPGKTSTGKLSIYSWNPVFTPLGSVSHDRREQTLGSAVQEVIVETFLELAKELLDDKSIKDEVDTMLSSELEGVHETLRGLEERLLPQLAEQCSAQMGMVF